MTATTLPSVITDKTNTPQKILAFGLLIASIYFGAKGVNYIFPTLIEAFKNIWIALIFGVPLLFVGGYIAMNPLFLWGFYKTITWNLTKFFIKMDPLSVMDRYVEYLKKKLKNLNKSIEVLGGKRIKLGRNINELNSKIESNKRSGVAALELGRKMEASTYGVKMKTDQSTLNILSPLLTRAESNLKMMQELSENWDSTIQQLAYQIEAKRAEFEIIKETHKGLKSAEDFINSDSEAAKLYGESIKALEEQVTQKISFIEEFERKSKPLMSNIAIEKQATESEGLKELESYLKGNDLTFTNFEMVESVPFKNTNNKEKKFNF